MRRWVASARSGQCACAALGTAFARRGAAVATEDFCVAMATIHRDGLAILRFGTPDTLRTTDDEARLLALFDAALTEPAGMRVMVAALVRDPAAERLTAAVRAVAAQLRGDAFLPPDR